MKTSRSEAWQKIARKVNSLLRLPNGRKAFLEQTRLAADQAVERRRVECAQAEYEDQLSDDPLPVPTRMLDACEKFAALSAIHDACLKGVDKVAPWGVSAHQKAVLSGLPGSGLPEDQYRQATWYYHLVRAAQKLGADELQTVAIWVAEVKSQLLAHRVELEQQKKADSSMLKGRIKVDLTEDRVKLDDTWYKVTSDAAVLINECLKCHPRPVFASHLGRGIRPERVKKSLPRQLKAVFRSERSRGCWLELEQ